LVAIKSFEIVT
jgi:peptide/nickel transport system substrate-binding protein